MDRAHIKREPLEEAFHLQNASTPSLPSGVKREAADRSTLQPMPDVNDSLARRGSQHQALQAASQQSRENLRQQWLEQNEARQQRQRGEQLLSQPSSVSLPESLPVMKQEPGASTPTRQRIKPEASPSSVSATPAPNCLQCDGPNAPGKCGNCDTAFYCSPVCQTRDWSRHHIYCTARVRDPGPDRQAALASQIAAQSLGPPREPALALAPASQQTCLKCKNPGVQDLCAMCNNAFYCSPDCQARDWPRHHAYCSQRIPGPGPAQAAASSNNFDHGAQSQYPSAIVPGNSDLSYDDEYGWPIQDNSEETRKLIELFASLPDIDVSPEDRKKAPNGMACNLMAHQRVGLTWMMEQENSIRNGGILADTMGLGKTIQALALILAHPSKDLAHKTTLIIAPLALLKQWEREIDDKTKPGYKLKTIIVHGQKKKSMTIARLLSYDVVLTTYGTVAAEYNPRKNAKTKKLIMTTRFHRIILDEAHNIKNDRSKAALAVTSIRAKYRLCMTGTPLMNNVKELFSLVRFLRISPYDSWQRFLDDFAKPMNGDKWEHSSAMKALQAFLRTILLQRTATSTIDGKQILNLPELRSGTAVTEFNEDQRDFYNHVERQMQLKFNKYLKAGTVLKNYSYILVLILRLRQCCCHPFLIMNHGIPDGAELKPEEMIMLALKFDDSIVERIRAETLIQCPVCDQVTDNPMIIHPCGHQICGECFTGLMLIRDADRHDDQDEPPFPNCPSHMCREVVDSRKALCHSFFVEAHSPQERSDGESVEEDLVEEDDISDDSDEADEDGNLKDFIVSDDDLGLFESDDEGETDKELDDEVTNSRPQSQISRSGSAVKESDQTSKEEVNGEESFAANGGKPSSSQQANAGGAGSDSDDSLPELGVVWQRAGDQIKLAGTSTPRTSGLPFKHTTKREPTSSSVKPRCEVYDLDIFRQSGDFFERQAEESARKSAKSKVAKSRMKRENGDESSNPRSKHRRISRTKRSVSGDCDREQNDSDNDTEAASRKRKIHKGKGVAKPKDKTSRPKGGNGKKKKDHFTSMAHLKSESNKNAAAKQRYLRRLRKQYESSAKIDRTMELLREIREKNPKEKTLIFSIFTSFLDLLEIPIQDAGYVYRRYDGAMCTGAREAAVDDFMKKPEVKIMLISLKAGNAGLNLQEATQVIILDPFWNPSVEDQAVGRAHRLGQKNPVTVHKTLVEDTIEDRIVALQDRKRALVGEVLNNEAARSMGRLSVNELAGLFGIGVSGRSRRR